MLRLTVPTDTPALVALTRGTGVFKPHEIDALGEVLDDYHTTNHEFGHTAYTWHDDDIRGFVYYAPTAMTDRTWEVWWIAVDKSVQGRGLGRQMLDSAEIDCRAKNARLLLIETSSLPEYEATRRFYLNHGYTITARIADFYSDGDDKVIFAKRLAAHPVGSG